MSYGTYKIEIEESITEEEEEEIAEYARLVGAKCARSILLYQR